MKKIKKLLVLLTAFAVVMGMSSSAFVYAEEATSSWKIEGETKMLKVNEVEHSKQGELDALTLTLNGKGYHYLVKGTEEDVKKAGLVKESWIKGDDTSGNWKFTFVLAKDETYVPFVSVSNKYLTQYEESEDENEKNELWNNNIFYARQFKVDIANKVLTLGDYNPEDAAKAEAEAKARAEAEAKAKAEAEAKAKAEAEAAKAKEDAKKLKVAKLKVKAKGKKLNVSWKKTSGADSYQVQYKKVKTKKWKNLKKSVKKVKVNSKKLKKGKYQVRVRTIKTVNGEKVYGKWTTSKKVKIK